MVLFLVVTWVAFLIVGFAPLTVLAVIVSAQDCEAWLLGLIATVVRHGVNADAAFLALVHIIIFTFSLLPTRLRFGLNAITVAFSFHLRVSYRSLFHSCFLPIRNSRLIFNLNSKTF